VTQTPLSAAERYSEWLDKPYCTLFVLESEEHRELVHRLRDEAEAWLAKLGIDQFTASPASKSAYAHQDIDRLFDAGQFVGIHESEYGTGRKLPGIGAVVAITEPDPDFWTPEEIAEPQGYLSRFLVSEHGRHYGTNLLFAVERLERYYGSDWLRLDCWRTNKKLHEYYLRQGFDRIRTEVVPGRMSGELFQFDLNRPATTFHLEHDEPRNYGI
jgi:hypothetical protein